MTSRQELPKQPGTPSTGPADSRSMRLGRAEFVAQLTERGSSKRSPPPLAVHKHTAWPPACSAVTGIASGVESS
jgi:hypothetical protein